MRVNPSPALLVRALWLPQDRCVPASLSAACPPGLLRLELPALFAVFGGRLVLWASFDGGPFLQKLLQALRLEERGLAQESEEELLAPAGLKAKGVFPALLHAHRLE